MNGHSAPDLAQRLKGKVAIITGGASGLGESTARLFARHGANVVIVDIVQDDKDTVVAKHGKLDIMFNNAGITGNLDPSILGTDNDNFKRVFEVNVYGAFLGAKHAARVMIPAKSGGVILFTSSIASVTGGESPHAYTMSKHAVIGLMKNLCVELGQYGIRVNAISPCAVATPLLRNATGGMDKTTLEGLISGSAVLKGSTPEPEDVAEAALYLVSDAAKFVSGLNLVVDGGYSTTNPSFSIALRNYFTLPKKNNNN
ncbi:hypothetical protein Dimus_006968 [Dionaea muscipula]